MTSAPQSEAQGLKGTGSRRIPAARRVGARSKVALAGVNCSAACPTRSHMTYGECLRAKNLQLSPAVNDSYGTKQKAWDRELNNYESAVRQGLEPAGTKQHHIDAAVRKADG